MNIVGRKRTDAMGTITKCGECEKPIVSLVIKESGKKCIRCEKKVHGVKTCWDDDKQYCRTCSGEYDEYRQTHF